MSNTLGKVTVTGSAEFVSLEGFGKQVVNGEVWLAGAYPLLDLDAADINQEYEKVSFLHNCEDRNRLFD